MELDRPVYEVYREKHQIVERRDGAVYRTKLVAKGWFADLEVLENDSSKTDIMFVHASTADPDAPMVGIRRA
jgi:hypothetical protein